VRVLNGLDLDGFPSGAECLLVVVQMRQVVTEQLQHLGERRGVFRGADGCEATQDRDRFLVVWHCVRVALEV
jgi:hypothetical protein